MIQIPIPPTDPVGDPEDEEHLVSVYESIQKEMDEWIGNHSVLQSMVADYIPEREFYHRHEKTGKIEQLKKSPLNKTQLRRAMRILYQCWLHSVPTNLVFDTVKDFIYLLVRRKLRFITQEELRDMCGFVPMKEEHFLAEWQIHYPLMKKRWDYSWIKHEENDTL